MSKRDKTFELKSFAETTEENVEETTEENVEETTEASVEETTEENVEETTEENVEETTEENVEETTKSKYLVEALRTYELNGIMDSELKRVPKAGEQWEVDSERLNVLLGNNETKAIFVKVVE